MLHRACCFAAVLATLCLGRCLPADDQFDLRDGDKIVLLGGALIEQEQLSGYWETLLTLVDPDRKVTFRNLGWSGDTVWGQSRGMFEPHLGYERLIAHVKQESPTLVIVAYGNTEAFGGEERLEPFADQLKRLIDDLSAPGRRFVFLSPLLMEAVQLPLASDTALRHAQTYNRDVVHFSDVIQKQASAGGQPYINLQQQQLNAADDDPLTDNGIRLTDAGYRQTARWLASRLSPRGNIDRLDALVDLDFETPEASRLRQAIIAKNRLYFHRWRPQNFTYLFGFRKREQGQNAVEIPQFDPLIATAETKIGHFAAELPLDDQP